MPRIRTVKPELYRHEGLFETEKATGLPLRIAFTGLLTCCDREGRFRWRPRPLKLDVLPYDKLDFAEVLEALETHGFIQHYTVGEREYGCIPTFTLHQRPSRDEPASEIPPPGETVQTLVSPSVTPPLRARIYERDQYCCVYCQEDLRDKPRSICLAYDRTFAQTGHSQEKAFVTCCKKCHARKIKGTPVMETVSAVKGAHPSVTPLSTAGDPTVNPPLTGINLSVNTLLTSVNPSLTVMDSPVSLPLTVLQPPVNPLLTEGNGRCVVEREKEREMEEEREKEGERKKSVVAPARPGERTSPDVLFVFNVWKTTLGHPQAVLDDKRKTLIQRALKSGYSVEQLCQAITGCSLTPHNMGKNDRGQRYDGLHVILRDADQIDRFIRNAQSPPRERNAAQALIDSNLAVCQEWLQDKLQQETPHEIQ